MAGYLYLFYEDYYNNSGIAPTDPYAKINMIKQEIWGRNKDIFAMKASSSEIVESEFETLYNLKDNEFTEIGIQSKINQLSQGELHDFDQAASYLRELVRKSKNVSTAVTQGNKIIGIIDQLLAKGAALGGLAESSYQELISGKQRMEEIQARLEFIESTGWTAEDRAWVIKKMKDIVSNVSGYMLEWSFTYAFLQANQKGLNGLISAMTNIGGHAGNITVTKKLDPKMQVDLDKINNALSENKAQSTADVIFNMHSGGATAQTTWVGFQAKNYGDISKVYLAEKSYNQLNILSYYDDNFLVNIAGTFAGDSYKAKLPSSRRTFKGQLSKQSDVDAIWGNIRDTMRIIGVADAIAKEFQSNFSNSVNYFVIRNKADSNVKVIGASKVYKNIINEMQQNNLNTISGWETDKWQEKTRQQYFTINLQHFSPNKNTEEAKWERSNDAYSEVLNAVLNTKIKISLNFSSFFQ